MPNARYVVGIDLGTTNTVLSYIDTEPDVEGQEAEEQEAEQREVRVLPIPQHSAPGVVEDRESLPSFLYLAAGPEFADDALDLPWAKERNYTIGQLAREQGASVPKRVIGSSKSWLCHAGVDRTAPILPWNAPEEVTQLSPLETAVRFLEHLRDAWNSTLAASDDDARLEQQDVLLTVPASFDAVARDLTMTAAKRAGLTVTLIEEPQAAFYAWLAQTGDAWRERLKVGDLVLVCDVGGGTTDFTLIAARDQDGDLVLERVAVGNHILLGGDNMDLALALTVAGDLKEDGHDLDAWQTRSLWHACRQAKEELLSNTALEKVAVSVLGRGSKVIGGTLKAELTREDIEEILLGGFFPEAAVSDRPKTARRGGFQELGLPYATDAAVTRHLAHFLAGHGDEGESSAWPTAILFNGGVMKAGPLRERIKGVLDGWLKEAERPALQQLDSESLDLAVSRGAAYYGMVRRGKGIRIRGGVARSYYIGIESALPAVPGMEAPLKALCVVPFGTEEGSAAGVLAQELGMIVGEPVEFRFLSSTTRKDDAAGTMVERWAEGEIEELSPIHTAMDGEADETGAPIPVRLHSRVTEVGTLDLELRARDGQSWKLEYDVREKRE